jgi:hypothetical protein
MFIQTTQLSQYEAALQLLKSYLYPWYCDLEACLAIAEYLWDQSEEAGGTPFNFDVVELTNNWAVYDDLEAFNKDHNTTFENVKDINCLTQIVPLSGERFLAENFI